MRLDTRLGEKVSFTGEGGYPNQNESANALLTVGAEYEVVSVDVGNWESSVKIKGAVQSYNTVMFDNLTECDRCGQPDDLNHHGHCPTCGDDMGTNK